jgi:anaerobic magnesium-protoporphyrin IX monomethyl ester cyclase
MKVCLINAPNTYELVGNDPVIIKDQQGVYPPLGILYIASYMQKHGFEMSIIDAQAEDLTHAEVAERVHEIKPDVVGLTAMTFTLVDVKLCVQEIRKRLKTTIIIGGPHTAIYPDECFEKNGLNADYVIVGEGEKTLVRLCQDIEMGKAKERIYRQTTFIEDLNELPFPARELTLVDKYYSVLSEDTPTTTAFSSRGCPFSCAYCDRPALGKGFRAMNASRVADEMQWCQERGIKEIFFYDDTFSVSMKRVMEICNEIKRRNIKIKWDVRTRVNVVNDELIKSMKEAGCERIHFGVETGNPRVVKELQKGTSIEQVEKAFDLCKKYNVKTLAYFMMGNPTETMDDVKDTLALSRRIKPDFMQMTILSPFPATQIYLRALQEGVIEGDPWRDYARQINDDFRPPLWDQIYTRQELESHLRWFYGKFYLTPRFVYDRVREVRNFGQFKRYASAGISLLKMTMIPEGKMKDSWGLRTRTGVASEKAPEAAVELH